MATESPTPPTSSMGLRTALFIMVIGPVALTIGIFAFVTLRAVESQAVERMEEDVQLVARALQSPLSRAVERDRAGSAAEALASAFRIGRVYGAYLYDSDGALTASFGIARPTEDRDRISELAEGVVQVGEYGQAGPEEVYSYFVPLTASMGRPIGLLQVTRRRSDIRETIASLRRRAALGLGFSLLVVVGLVALGHHRAVGRPLTGILQSMERVGRGERDHRADPSGPREIAGLGRGLNQMLDSIEEAEEDVRRHREEQIRLERELRDAAKLAAVGRLSAGLAHELGGPLSIADGHAQRLLRRDDLAGEARDEALDLRQELTRMSTLIRQLLEYGKGGGGRFRPVRLGDLARSVARDVEDEAQRLDIDVRVEQTGPGPSVQGDPARLGRAVENLVRNAFQATGRGGTVEVACLRDRGKASLEVRDDGPGVPEELRDQIFEPFFSTKVSGQGTGLGLALVHGVADEHGGTVTVRESPLGGAAFRLVFPADSDNGPDDETGPAMGVADEPAETSRG